MTKQELDDKIEEIIYNNVELIGDEGSSVNTNGLTQAIIDLIKSLSFTDLTKIREMI